MTVTIRKARHPYSQLSDLIVKRFIDKIDLLDISNCWLWKAKKDKDDYGIFSIDKKRHKAHRVALMICGMKPSDKNIVRHLCGNPACVNPAHLKEGSQKENATDRTRHGHDGGLKRTGESNGRSKLTEAEVNRIRNGSDSLFNLARMHHVSKTAIRFIKINKTWKSN